jgi:hypothetical protein
MSLLRDWKAERGLIHSSGCSGDCLFTLLEGYCTKDVSWESEGLK